MTTTTVNRGEKTAIPFSITDGINNALAGTRVTAALASSMGGKAVLTKVGGLPGSSADIFIATQAPALITGSINITVADFATLVAPTYYLSLWVDDGAGNDRCVTPGGADVLQIVSDVPRA